ncbi:MULTISPECIES: hypothetical protein [Brevundimonas]|uniref:hypothetical protein n=1 Tax=Brevundimonas TaxID=41275 RepID=UPI000F01A40B|nr:hypothetical protein [Brevundimonas lutea]
MLKTLSVTLASMIAGVAMAGAAPAALCQPGPGGDCQQRCECEAFCAQLPPGSPERAYCFSNCPTTQHDCLCPLEG